MLLNPIFSPGACTVKPAYRLHSKPAYTTTGGCGDGNNPRLLQVPNKKSGFLSISCPDPLFSTSDSVVKNPAANAGDVGLIPGF